MDSTHNLLRSEAPSSNSFIHPIRILRSSGNVNYDIDSGYTLSNTTKSHAELVLDYGRAEGGIPVFDISAAHGPASISFRVTYSETHDGIDSETGDGPYFLFSNAMDTYRSISYTIMPNSVPQIVEARYAQRAQRYQRLTLTSLDCSVTFSSISFRRVRPEAPTRSAFKCSNAKLNHIWLDGVRTVDMCTVAKGETTEAWDVTENGTRVYGQHWAPCRHGTRWTNKKVTFQVKIEHHGASWGVHMVANGLIFCLDAKERTLTAFEGLSDKSAVFPATPRGSWTLPSDLKDTYDWLYVETIAVGTLVKVSINGNETATVRDLQINPLLGGAGPNSGSVAFGGPAGWVSLYKSLVVSDGDQNLYTNSLLPVEEARTLADFAVGTNQLPCTIDGAKRDRAVFGGDLHVMGRSMYYSTMNMEAAAGSIKLLTSHQTKDGYLGNLCPIQSPVHTGTEEPPTYAFYSLGYALLLVVAIKDYWMHSGDNGLVAGVWDGLELLIKFTSRFVNSQGLVVTPPPLSMTYFPMGGPVFGASSQINLAFFDALKAMAAMCSVSGNEDQYTRRAETLKQNIIAHLWSNRTGILRMSDQSPEDSLSQDTNAYSISLGVSPSHPRDEQTLRRSDEELPLAFERLERWDKLGVVSPYATGFAVEACFERGLGHSAVNLLEKVWGLMADPSNPNYSGGHWETLTAEGKPFHKDTSLMHGWSTWPVHLLPRYLAGVYPVQAGWKRWAVKPVLAGLEWVDVTMQTVAGCVEVEVSVRDQEGTGKISFRGPFGTETEVFAPDGWLLVHNKASQVYSCTGAKIELELCKHDSDKTELDSKRLFATATKVSEANSKNALISSPHQSWVSKQFEALQSMWTWLSRLLRSTSP